MIYVDRLEQSDVIRRYYPYGQKIETIAGQTGKDISEVNQERKTGLEKLKRIPAVKKAVCEYFVDGQTNFYMHIGVEAFQRGTGSVVETLTKKREKIRK